jgi:DNA excision repair protein ERCC-4
MDDSSSPPLLEYEAKIFQDTFQKDSLLIMAEGLGIERIFLHFIRLYSDSSHLVIILNTHEAEEEYFLNRLKESPGSSVYGNEINSSKSSRPEPDGGGAAAISVQLPTKITTETHSMSERVDTYMKGGCFFITSRILVVDMLTDRIPIEHVSGILVYNAHKIIDSCQESFILRMFRQKNKVITQ